MRNAALETDSQRDRARSSSSLGAALVAAAILISAGGLAIPAAAQEPAGNVLTLEEAYRSLQERSLELEAARESVVQAEALIDQAQAVLYPTVNLTGVYTLRDEEVSFRQSNPYAPLLPYLQTVYDASPALRDFFADNPDVPDVRLLAQEEVGDSTVTQRHDVRLSGTINQTLFNARAFPLLRAARLTEEQANASIDELRYRLEGGLYELYFAAVGLARFVEISERNVELSQINFERSRIAFEEHVGTRFEMTRAEVALNRAQRELDNARLAYQLAIESLATYLHREPDFDVVSPPALSVPERTSVDIGEAVEQRPELAVSALSVEIAEARVDESEAKIWPFVSAQFQTSLQRESAFSGDRFQWNFSVTASWDAFDGGIRRAEQRERESAVAELELLREDARRQLASQIRQAWLRVETQQHLVSTARSEAELARRNVEVTREAFDAGAASALDVETAQEQVFLADLAAVSAETDLQLALYELYWLASIDARWGACRSRPA